MACECSIVGLLTNNIPGLFQASIDGSTSVEIAEDSGVVLLGQTISTLSIQAYAFAPGNDPFLGVSCNFSAQAQIPWLQKFDCFTGNTYFIPKSGGKASMTNREKSGISLSIIDMTCNPNLESTSFSADASSGPTTPFYLDTREDGFNLVYTGSPLAVATGIPKMYTIDLGFAGTIRGFLQSFSLNVSPPDVAKVRYDFVFSGII